MFLSYRSRLRRDLALWEARGLIEPAQRARIAADALAAPGLGALHAILVLCLVILASTAIIAFVAANWSGASPAVRMAILFAANGAAVYAAYRAAERHAHAPSPWSAAMADGAATLSLAIAATSVALVAQTFHLPSDTRGFARTIAGLGLVTALVARSGGAGLVACAALFVGDTSFLDAGSGDTGTSLFWLVGAALFLVGVSGWIPARTANLLMLFLALANHLGGGASEAEPLPKIAWLFAVALFALAGGHALTQAPTARIGERWREGGEAILRAAAGLVLLAIAAVAAKTLGWTGARLGWPAVAAVAAWAIAAAILVVPWRRGGGAPPLADLVVLGSATLALAVFLVSPGGTASRHADASSFLTICGGVLPALGLVVAGHLDERRTLFGWSLVLVAGLIVGMLATSRNLLEFAFYLMLSAGLVGLALAACRRLDRRIAARTA